jgi:hypothetical protein
MKPQRNGTSVIVTLAAVSLGLAVMPVASVSAAAGGFCSAKASYTGTTITWTGKGDGHSWSKAANWSPSTVPDVHQTSGSYVAQYVCIGDGKGGKPANVTVNGNEAYHVAGVDVGQGAHLTLKLGAQLFLGSNSGSVIGSKVEKRSQLQLDAATLGGNGPLTVHGTMRWTGQKVKGHKDIATQTAPAGGRTTIAAGGKMLVDGTAFGGVYLTGKRVIDNFGTIMLTGFGFIAMNNGTQLIDEPRSALRFYGVGGIYRGAHTAGAAPNIQQHGKVVRDGGGTNVVVVGVPVSFGKTKPNISILRGSLVLDGAKAPKSPVRRNSGYGVGSCVVVKLFVCKKPFATTAQPQVALAITSAEAGSPTVSHIAVSLAKAPSKLHGHVVLGQAIDVTAPTEKTTHSTHLSLMFDSTTAGLKSSTKPIVYRDGHRITLCKVHGLTAKNTSCVFSEAVAHSGSAPFAGGQQTKGDLTLFIITIQPDAHWIVTT